MPATEPLRIEIIGLEETDARLHALNLMARSRVADVVKETADNVVSGAQSKVPRRTGQLHDSIHAEFSRGGLAGEVLVDAFYGHFVEFGTRHAAAQPFLHPSWEEERPAYLNRVRQAIRGLAKDVRRV